MKGIAVAAFLLLLYLVLNLDDDPLGWNARERVAQLQLQQVEIQAQAQLEAQRLEQAAAMQRAQFRAQLISQYVNVLPLTLGLICAAALTGLALYSWWHHRPRAFADRRATQGSAVRTQSPPPALPLLQITSQDLHQLRQQAKKVNHRLEVVGQGRQHTALLIDNPTGKVRAQRTFVLKKEAVKSA